MDIRDLKWDERKSGNTLMQQIEALAERVKIPADKRKDLYWLSRNLRSEAHKDKSCCCELKVLISYVQLALQQGIDNLNG